MAGSSCCSRSQRRRRSLRSSRCRASSVTGPVRRRRELPKGRMRGGWEEKLSKMSPMRAKKTKLNSENGHQAAVSERAEAASRPKEGGTSTPNNSWCGVHANATLGVRKHHGSCSSDYERPPLPGKRPMESGSWVHETEGQSFTWFYEFFRVKGPGAGTSR